MEAVIDNADKELLTKGVAAWFTYQLLRDPYKEVDKSALVLTALSVGVNEVLDALGPIARFCFGMAFLLPLLAGLNYVVFQGFNTADLTLTKILIGIDVVVLWLVLRFVAVVCKMREFGLTFGQINYHLEHGLTENDLRDYRVRWQREKAETLRVTMGWPSDAEIFEAHRENWRRDAEARKQRLRRETGTYS